MECNRDTSASTGQLSTASSLGGGVGGMHHSLSTPAGVDGGARTPPTTPKKGGKMLAIRVQMLDDTITIFQVQAKANGRVLFEQVCKQLHLLEADYFGLEYQDDTGIRYWLDLQKPVSRQLGLSLVDPLLYFCVKFYTPDPSQLEEEYTRYLFCLQVKRDLAHGLLQCNDNTAALMASYIVQAECGDYVAEDYPDHTYLSSYKFVPHQDHEMERRIMENHKKHAGQSPAEADLNLLETARRCELYGIKMHPAKDHDNVPLNLAVAHMGIVVFQNYTKINTFSWAKIRKISFKRKRFLIKLHPEGYGYYKDVVEFFFEGRNECKNFWKKCVEHHGFFRCSIVKTMSRHKTRVLSRGSSFRYSGKTQKQIVEFVRDNYVKRQAFQRSASFRHSSAHSSATNMHTSTVGNSISAHPLLPLGDATAEASRRSASAQSMDVVAEAHLRAPASPTTRSVSRHRDTATCWPPTTPPPPAPTTTSSSPPPTTRSASPDPTPSHHRRTPSPVAVRASVHRVAAAVDPTTGTTTHTTRTITARTPSNTRATPPPSISSSRTPPTHVFSPPAQTQSQNDLDAPPPHTYNNNVVKRKIWRRSASCRELYDYSFEESGRAKRRPIAARAPSEALAERRLESPITRYDDSRVYAVAHDDSLELELRQDIMVDTKVYSSSYPGTTVYAQQESVEDPGNYDLRDSQDDLSHDSYELIERSDDDDLSIGEYRYAKTKVLSARSCSLDSGNYLPSDLESDAKKCKSSVDLFAMDDPRDYPREKIPRKSDGSFYKVIKSSSRASSLESRSEHHYAKSSRRSSRENSFTSRTSSQESRSDHETHQRKNTRRNKSLDNSEGRKGLGSRNSSFESKSDYYDASKLDELAQSMYEFDRRIPFERNYGTQKPKEVAQHNGFYTDTFKQVSHVHSVSLQNVETDSERFNHIVYDPQHTIPRSQKLLPARHDDKPSHASADSAHKSSKSTDSESNIFSFDEDRIQSLQESEIETTRVCAEHAAPLAVNATKEPFRNFIDIEPNRLEKGREPFPLHQPIERTKSDPNSLARQRLNFRRHLLIHQKSIDLTPADSSDDDYIYRQIPSAPPITKYKGSRFEMPTAEFGHFDILKRECAGQKTKFEVPKSQFEVLGVQRQSDLINPPKSNEIPYTLHKRHVMNGTATKEELTEEAAIKPKSPLKADAETFLFTQNIDLSKVDPVTLEIDKSKTVQHISSPKRDITRIDPALLETLNSKLSQIESDSPTSSKTESLKPDRTKTCRIVPELKSQVDQATQKSEIKIKAIQPRLDAKVKEKLKGDIKTKRGIKSRGGGVGKKGGKSHKAKVRITSFSSDDESLDSDDVFGSAEATPTKLEFSPPQTRKEMESILKYEAERKYLQYTMSSTEVEGSPPQTRKNDFVYDRTLDPNYQTELRRISERSISIPSSDDDLNIATADLQPVFGEPGDMPLPPLPEVEKIAEEAEEMKDIKEETESEVEYEEKPKEMAVHVQDLPDQLDAKTDEEKEKEKALLLSDIEKDIRDLKVPSKTKITEICSPSSRRKGQSSVLFAHARLNLSEGSAFSMLQKQQATESLVNGRRTKSLDTPVISVNRLPPLNSFSSKDDTVEEEQQEATSVDVADIPVPKPAIKPKPEKEKDQIVPDVTAKPKKPPKPVLQPKGTTKVLDKPKLSPKRPPKELPLSKANGKPPIKPPSTKTPAKLPPEAKLVKKDVAKQRSLHEKPTDQPDDDKVLTTQKSLPTQLSLSVPEPNEIQRARSQELEQVKRPPTKEKAKSIEKIELRRSGSRERAKSQDDSDVDSAKRKEKQQMLYETAIKQTKTIKSPVKDVLPVFPQVEEYVRERHGKLEISINTIENTGVSLEDAIIITKSPKRLDKKIDKLAKSLELNLTRDYDEVLDVKSMQRLGKSLDLENRPREPEVEPAFDFHEDIISSYAEQDQLEKPSPEIIEARLHEIVEAEVHEQPESQEEGVILEGTTLDVWLKMNNNNKKDAALDQITLIKKSDDFFEERPKPPDLTRIETKSSSDSQSAEKVSLGNSLDMKFIDDSGDSSHKSEQDQQLAEEIKRASATVGRFLAKKLANKRKTMDAEKEAATVQDSSLVRITSEDESLTEVSELKCEDNNFLGVGGVHRDALLKLSIERSRSEETTGSWMTVECDEYVGTEESFDTDVPPLDSPERETEHAPISAVVIEASTKDDEPEQIECVTPEDQNLLTTESRNRKKDLLKRSSDQSRSSDTTGSWTSGEKDLSPSNLKETGDESSMSCTMGQAIGLSQTIEKSASRDLLDHVADVEQPRSPRSPRSPRICVLGRAFTIDEDSNMQRKSDSSDSEGNERNGITAIDEADELKLEPSENGFKYRKTRYPFEEKWSSESELGQRVHQKIVKKLSSSEDVSDGRGRSRPFLGVEKSADSKSSLDTESSSGSLGIAARMQKTGEIVPEASSTWKAFPLDSSGSSSLEEGILAEDQEKEYFMAGARVDNDVTPTKDDNSDLQDELSDFPASFGYSCLTPNGTIGITLNSADVLGGYSSAAFLGRTLSRISERSTNSEKSSLEEDSTKASIQLDSLNDESLSDHNEAVSTSSDPPSHARGSNGDNKTPTNGTCDLNRRSDKLSSDLPPFSNLLLQRQISDDRRTSAEMAELSIDDIEIITSESGLKLMRQGSDDTVIDEENLDAEKRGSSSQESDEWPLPDIPQCRSKPLMALHEAGSSDASQLTTQVFRPPQTDIPKVFGLRGSLRSQDSEPWPSPPSSVHEPITGHVETHYITPPEEPCSVIVHSNTVSTYENDSNSEENKTDVDGDKSVASDPTYENVAPDQISEAISETSSGVKIILENRSGESGSSNSDELNISNLNDDVFVDTVEVTRSELRPPTVLRRSTASDDSHSSHSRHKLSAKTNKSSHSSQSEDEECTSSMGTNLDGTVRLAIKHTKCTHSSHSEDTSIALSLSEWSNSTNTVKFQNLSTSNSGATKSSSGLKSDDNSLADIAQSISEWSSSNSNTLKAAQTSSLQFQKLSSSASTGDSSTLTEFIPTISERSSSDTSKTLIPQHFFPVRQSVTRLGSSIDDLDIPYEQKNIKSPQNIPSEDYVLVSTSLPAIVLDTQHSKSFSKSSERPVLIPSHFLSDTESSSVEQKTVHTKEKKCAPKHHASKSTERPIKVPLSKCSPYYSSSLSSESTPAPTKSVASVSKTATFPLTRNHRKPVSKGLFPAKNSPPSENDSTSSMESPKSTPESRDRRGYRRRRQLAQKRVRNDKEQRVLTKEDVEYNEYVRMRSMEEMASNFQYEEALAEEMLLQSVYTETLEEGYFPDGDSQSGSDIFRMEREEEPERFEVVVADAFDVASIPPPLIEDDYEERPTEI